MFNQVSLAQGELHLYQTVQVSADTTECLDLCVFVCDYLNSVWNHCPRGLCH